SAAQDWWPWPIPPLGMLPACLRGRRAIRRTAPPPWGWWLPARAPGAGTGSLRSGPAGDRRGGPLPEPGEHDVPTPWAALPPRLARRSDPSDEPNALRRG